MDTVVIQVYVTLLRRYLRIDDERFASNLLNATEAIRFIYKDPAFPYRNSYEAVYKDSRETRHELEDWMRSVGVQNIRYEESLYPRFHEEAWQKANGFKEFIQGGNQYAIT